MVQVSLTHYYWFWPLSCKIGGRTHKLFVMSGCEDLKELRNQIHEKNLQNLVELTKITDVALDRLENHSCHSENNEKARALLTKLKGLCNEREKVYLEIKKNHELLAEKYANSPQTNSGKKLAELQLQRDQAFELSKRMLFVLKSTNARIQENSKKSKQSADLMFHVLYKVEDNYLPS